MSYATMTDLGNYIEAETPQHAARMLERASSLIDLIVVKPYDVDDDGNPTKQEIKDALRDAVCAQVEYWIARGEDVDKLGDLKSISIGRLSMSFDAGSGGGGDIAPRAMRELATENLLSRSLRS